VQMNRMDDAMGSLGGASFNRQMMQHDISRAKVCTMHRAIARVQLLSRVVQLSCKGT
jgi:hypothetical protein